MEYREHNWKTGDGLSLYGQTWLPQPSPRGVITLLHGLGEHTGRYDHWVNFFLEKCFAVAAMDLRGHGRSDGPRGHAPSFDALSADISLLLTQAEKLAPAQPRFLYGHSFGGVLGLYYLVKCRPNLTGVIITSPGFAPAKDPGIKLIVGRLLDRLVPGFTMSNDLDRSGLSRDVQVEKRYSADPLVHDRISARMGIELIDNGRWMQSQASQLPAIPILLMQGTADRLVNTHMVDRFAAQAGPLLTYKSWPDHYHELHNEPDKQQVLEYVAAWIEPLAADRKSP